ncbi:hypothetical protein KC19_8G098000 [Ceratodon purpureus]|uniref:Uncharacterized protein n=1 Tax=Ceratodon purpureus TaxID=3225 RepID=A0A8T0H0E0_CERPU|nr:hypothetical protein KC19_8G098000 [Ceratodon purpureus]
MIELGHFRSVREFSSGLSAFELCFFFHVFVYWGIEGRDSLVGFEDKGGVGCVKHRLFSEKEKEPWSIISLNTYVTMVTMIRTGGA